MIWLSTVPENVALCGSLTAVEEMSGIDEKLGKCQQKSCQANVFTANFTFEATPVLS